MLQIEKVAELPGHEHPVYALASSQKQHIIFSGGGEGAIVEWSLKDFRFIKLMFKTGASIYSILCPEEYPILISGDRVGQISIFNFLEQKLVFQKKLTEKGIFGLQVFENKLFFISEDGYLRSLNLEAFEEVTEYFITDHPIRSISLNKENKLLYLGVKDHKIYTFSLIDSSVIEINEEHTLPIFSLVYDEEKKQLFSGSRDAQIKVWKAEGMHNIAAHMFAVNDLILPKDFPYLISASMDKSIKVWDKENYNLLAILDYKNGGHLKSVNTLTYTSYEHLLVSAGDDRILKVWKLV